jgi:hypothetical protein
MARGGMARLPAHPEVPGALRRLEEDGLRQVVVGDLQCGGEGLQRQFVRGLTRGATKG